MLKRRLAGLFFLLSLIFATVVCVDAFAGDLKINEIFYSVKDPSDPKRVERTPGVFSPGQKMFFIFTFEGVTVLEGQDARLIDLYIHAGIMGPNKIIIQDMGEIGHFEWAGKDFDPMDAYIYIPWVIPIGAPAGEYDFDLGIHDNLGQSVVVGKSQFTVISKGTQI